MGSWLTELVVDCYDPVALAAFWAAASTTTPFARRTSRFAAALYHIGGLLGTATLATTPAGHRALLAWLVGFGPAKAVGVEGTGSYGAALARRLSISEVLVVALVRPNRQIRRRDGKTDVVDVIAALPFQAIA